LHLNEFKRHFSWVFEAVPLRCKNVNALIFAHQFFAVANHHLGRALHDDPMLGAVMMHLHRQLTAWFYVQKLDLEAAADVERFEKAPRPVVAQVLLLFLAVGAFECGNNLRDLLRPGLIGHK